MWALLGMYLFVDMVALRFLLGLVKYYVLRYKEFSLEEIARLAGPYAIIPHAAWTECGGQLMYQVDSYSRKLPHVLHWAGLAHITIAAAATPWARFQFQVHVQLHFGSRTC